MSPRLFDYWNEDMDEEPENGCASQPSEIRAPNEAEIANARETDRSKAGGTPSWRISDAAIDAASRATAALSPNASFSVMLRAAIDAAWAVDGVRAIDGRREPGPYERCTDCGERMVWSSEEHKESWMCPSCVWHRMVSAERSLGTAGAGAPREEAGK